MTPQTRGLIEAAEPLLKLMKFEITRGGGIFSDAQLDNLRAAISSAKAAEEGVGLQIVAPQVKRERQPYVKIRGSGWFWCHHKTIGNMEGWSVLYINALWGAKVTDGSYVRTDNFDDVIGPLDEPESVREKEGL